MKLFEEKILRKHPNAVNSIAVSSIFLQRIGLPTTTIMTSSVFFQILHEIIGSLYECMCCFIRSFRMKLLGSLAHTTEMVRPRRTDLWPCWILCYRIRRRRHTTHWLRGSNLGISCWGFPPTSSCSTSACTCRCRRTWHWGLAFRIWKIMRQELENLPPCVTHRPLSTYQVSSRSDENSVTGRTSNAVL